MRPDYFVSSPAPFRTRPVEEKRDLELEEESLISSSSLSSSIVRKMRTYETSHGGSLDNVAHVWMPVRAINRLFMNVYIVLIKAKINVLLPFGPLAVLLHYLSKNQGWVFFFSLLGITPLAERLGYATEQLAYYTGPIGGGLLNATFGNVTEMIISIYALKDGMIRVVQQSLLGSILSNLLLVLGCAFFTGGIVHYQKDQVFNKAAVVVNSGLLMMTVMSITFPAVLYFTNSEILLGKSELALSRFISCIMLVAYATYLVFQFKSHQNLHNPINQEVAQNEEVSDEEGNATEHASAMMFAMKDKLDISLGVSIGSSTQISMFVIPFCVVAGWIAGKPMDLNFQLFETTTLFVAILVVVVTLQEGTANYFKGLMLILCYLVVAASFFLHSDPSNGYY